MKEDSVLLCAGLMLHSFFVTTGNAAEVLEGCKHCSIDRIERLLTGIVGRGVLWSGRGCAEERGVCQHGAGEMREA